MDGGSLNLGAIEKHFWLTRSVARVIGVNMSECLALGLIDDAGYADLITRCRAGGCSVMCEAWLATESGRPDSAPRHCANAEALNRLARGARR